MSDVPLGSFSPNGSSLVVCGSDGRLYVWDVDKSEPNQEYTPPNHLTSPTTALCWLTGSFISSSVSRTKKKRGKHDGHVRERETSLLAIGCRDGSIFIYNTLTAELHSHLTDGHSARVNSLCFDQPASTLFSCSDDLHIAQWFLGATGANTSLHPQNKWKADRRPIYSLTLSPTATHLVSASRNIRVWHLDDTNTAEESAPAKTRSHSTKPSSKPSSKLVHNYTGHAGEVHQLLTFPTHSSGGLTNGQSDAHESFYILSTSRDERLVLVWLCNVSLSKADDDATTTTPIISLSSPDQINSISISPLSTDPKDLRVCIVGLLGSLYLYKPILNGRHSSPTKSSRPPLTLQPHTTLVMASPSHSSDHADNTQANPLHIYWAHILSSGAVLLAYGTSSLLLRCERWDSNESKGEIYLVREVVGKRDVSAGITTTTSKVKVAVQSTSSKLLVPGSVGMGRETTTDNEVSLGDRLGSLTAPVPSNDAEEKPGASAPDTSSGKSLAVLLSQGLTSGDRDMLDTVLTNQKTEGVVRRTVNELPVKLVLPLLSELSSRVEGQPLVASHALVWLTALLSLHASHIASQGRSVTASAANLCQRAQARTTLASRFERLQGKLELVLAQASRYEQSRRATSAVGGNDAAITYQDDSSSSLSSDSDDDDKDDDLKLGEQLLSHSESEMDTDGGGSSNKISSSSGRKMDEQDEADDSDDGVGEKDESDDGDMNTSEKSNDDDEPSSDMDDDDSDE